MYCSLRHESVCKAQLLQASESLNLDSPTNPQVCNIKSPFLNDVMSILRTHGLCIRVNQIIKL